jgi:AraC family transcriptional regulator
MSAIVRRLFRSRQIGISEFICDQRRSPAGAAERTSAHELVFVRRGVFVLRAAGRETVITPNQAIIFPAGCDFSIAHPANGGDECVIVAMDDEVFHDALHAPPKNLTFPVTNSSYLAHHHLARCAAAGSTLETEERAFALIRSVSRDVVRASSATCASTNAERRGVRIALELLSVRFAEHLPLLALAREAGMSPWHLSRSFRKTTGETLHRYQNRLRLRSALLRLLEGDADLTGVALDYGYYDHSHFTGAFRREFGIPPSQARQAFIRN